MSHSVHVFFQKNTNVFLFCSLIKSEINNQVTFELQIHVTLLFLGAWAIRNIEESLRYRINACMGSCFRTFG